MKKAALFQSNYIPWKGYFDIINDVDIFVFYDDVQYTKRDWRNRNYIKAKSGTILLTVPVQNDDLRNKKIYEVEIDQKTDWQEKHLKTILLSYAKSPHLNEYKDMLNEIYVNNRWENLCELNRFCTKIICEKLGIKTQFLNLEDMNIEGNKNGERILKVCKEIDCDYVLNGPAAQEFVDDDYLAANGVTIEYKKYDYPPYRQLNFPFEHGVSVLDLLFQTGKDAPKYIWGERSEKIDE